MKKSDVPLLIPNNWNLEMPALFDEKKRHYWIWSKEPNRGKTTFANTLLE